MDEIQLWSILWRPEWQIGGLRGLSQFTLSGRRMPRLSRNSPAPEQVTPVVTEVGGEEASLVSRGTKLLSGQGPIQQILSSKSRLPPIV